MKNPRHIAHGLIVALIVAAATGLLAPPGSREAMAASEDGAAAGGDDAGVTGRSPTSGPVIDLASIPASATAGPPACSLRGPICVHAAPGTQGAMTLATLAAAERAWDALTGPLGAPAPDGGLDGVWHVYLVDAVGVGGGRSSRAVLDSVDPRGPFDRAASFALVDRTTPPGCALDLALARAVTRGALWRAAPATDEGSADAQVETLARLETPCLTGDDVEDADAFESHPERALVDRASPSSSRGAARFFGWLDTTFGAQPGALVVGLWALASTKTPPGAWRWAGAPTGFDVLRTSLADALWQGSTLADVFVRFAVVRASFTPRPHLSWHIPWPAQARRLASGAPIAPTGASYLAVDLAGAPPGAKLRVEVEWEDYARMRWVVAKVDDHGKLLDAIPIASTDLATQASITVENLERVDHLLVIGVNVGGTERLFDPNDGEWEPHGWLVTVLAR